MLAFSLTFSFRSLAPHRADKVSFRSPSNRTSCSLITSIASSTLRTAHAFEDSTPSAPCVDTALLRERRTTGAWLRREPAAGENGVVLVSLLRRENQDANIVSEHATSSGQEKK